MHHKGLHPAAVVAMEAEHVGEMAAARVHAVQASTDARYRLAQDFYRGERVTKDRSRYGRAELSYLRWAIDRGVLDAPAADGGGSPWWRAISDELLHDKVEADMLADASGTASSRNVELWLEFIRAPSPMRWFRAHNASIVAGFLKHESLAASELLVERFMINVVLIRVMYAHALAAASSVALGRLAPLGRVLGDPRGRWVGLFLDLHNQFPEGYPLEGWSIEELISEHGQLARVIDYGLIPSDLTVLYGFAAAELGEPRVTALIADGTPCYAWPAEDRAPWLAGATWPLGRVIARIAGHPYR
jgi:hypothetical protein